MILAFKHVPPDAHDTDGRWVYPPIPLNDESELGPLPDGEWALYVPTKTTIEGPDAENDLPSSFKFDRVVTVRTEAPKVSVV